MYRNKTSIANYYRSFLKSLEESIMKSDDNYIINTETSQIISDLVAKSGHSLLPIEFDNSRKESIRYQKETRNVPAHMREDYYRDEGNTKFEYETVIITIPIVSNPTINTIKNLGTNTSSLSWAPEDFHWGQDAVVLSMDVKGYGFKYDDQRIINEVSNLKKRIHDWVGWANADIEQGSVMIEKELPIFISNRKNKLKEDSDRLSDLAQKLGMPIE